MTAPTLTPREALELIANTDPIDAALDPQRLRDIAAAALAAQPELPEPAGRMAWWEARPKVEWVGRPPETGELLYTAAQLQQAVEQAQAKPEPMTREQMREIFLANGFTVKAGQDDLKDYVYAAWRDAEAHHNIGDKA